MLAAAREVEMEQGDFMNGFNLYNTDEETQPVAAPAKPHKVLRLCLLFLLIVVVLFICGIWVFDIFLRDSWAAPKAQLKSKTVHLEKGVGRLKGLNGGLSSVLQPSNVCQNRFKTYFERCIGEKAACDVPACFADDVDMGVSLSADSATFELGNVPVPSPWERTCISVPSLADSADLIAKNGARVQCGTDLAQVRAATDYQPEIVDSFEWLSTTNETIHLELWGGGGGGAGSIDVGSLDTAAWICGGGGGSGSAISLVWELQAGFSYRIEIGKGGKGGLPGKNGGKGSSSKFFEHAPGESWKLIAEAGGGYGGGKLHQVLLFSPGGRGGVAMSNASNACALPGMDGQSSRSQLSVGPAIPIPGTKLKPPKGLVLNASSRVPCKGKESSYGSECPNKPDFFLTCDSERRCIGAVQVVPVVQAPEPNGNQAPRSQSEQYNFNAMRSRNYPQNNYLFAAAPAGGTPPHGSGGVRQPFGRGGNGQCVAIRAITAQRQPQNPYMGHDFDRYVVHVAMPQAPETRPPGLPGESRDVILTKALGTEGSRGTRGFASIRACERLQAAAEDITRFS